MQKLIRKGTSVKFDFYFSWGFYFSAGYFAYKKIKIPFSNEYTKAFSI